MAVHNFRPTRERKRHPTLKPGQPFRPWIPYVVLIVALLLTAVAVTYVANTTEYQDRLRFQNVVTQAATRIANHLDSYVGMLRAGKSFMASHSGISHNDFQKFVAHLELDANYPGVRGIGLSIRVDAGAKDSLIAAVRREWMDTFDIWPADPRSEYHAIVDIHPLDLRNRAAAGYDMFSEPTRRDAMSRARDSGRPAATGKVKLRQEIEGSRQNGFLIYYPFYRGGEVPSTVAGRRAALLGFIYSPFRADDLLKGVFTKEGESRVDFRVFDGLGVIPQNLLHTSSSNDDTTRAPYTPRFTQQILIDVAGRPWTILFSSKPEFDVTSGTWVVPYIFAGGIFVSLILFGLSRAQAQARMALEKSALELQRSRERYRTIIETVPDVIYSLAEDGTILSLSPAFEPLTGWKIDEWVGKPFAPLIHPDDLHRAVAIFLSILDGANPDTYELRILNAAGEYLIVEFRSRPHFDSGAIIGSIGIARDITERKKVEDSIRQSEERYRAFMENSSEAIWRCELDEPIDITLPEDEQIDTMFGHAWLAECNDAMARMYGFESAGEIMGTRLAELLIVTDPQNVAYLRAFVQSGYHLVDAESVETDREGNVKHFSNNLVGIVEGGRLVRAWGTQRDITARLQAEMEVRRAMETAEAANRAKDQFLAVLSHELRTPLTPVLTAIQILGEEPGLGADLRSLLDIIQRNVELEARLIDDLLDLTRITNGKLQLHPEVVDVHALLRAAIDISGADLRGKNLHLDLHLDAVRHHVMGDPARLQQVFWNLIKNAVKFTPAEGRIAIRSRNDGGLLHVEVADTGIGIEPHILPHIFNAFEQGEKTITRKFGGLGLGLAISRMLIDLHGGSIAAASEGADRGATFSVDLETVPPADGAAAPAVAEIHDPHPHRILLVDDHGDTIMVLKTLLERHGYHVITASSVESALRVMEREEVDLLVSDIGLPDGTGLDIMRQLRRDGKIKGIALSGFGMEEDIRKSLEAGFSEHLAKPVNFKVLHESVRRLLEG